MDDRVAWTWTMISALSSCTNHWPYFSFACIHVGPTFQRTGIKEISGAFWPQSLQNEATKESTHLWTSYLLVCRFLGILVGAGRQWKKVPKLQEPRWQTIEVVTFSETQSLEEKNRICCIYISSTLISAPMLFEVIRGLLSCWFDVLKHQYQM